MNAIEAKPQASDNVISFFRESKTALAKVQQARRLAKTLPDQIKHQRNLGYVHSFFALVLFAACWSMVWYMAHSSLTLGAKGALALPTSKMIVTIIAGGFSFGITAFIFSHRQENKRWHWPAIVGYLAIIGVFVFNAMNALFPAMYVDLASAVGATIKQASKLADASKSGVTSPWIGAVWLLKGVVALVATLGLMFAELGTFTMEDAARKCFAKRAELAGVLDDAKDVVERANSVGEHANKVASIDVKTSQFSDDEYVISHAAVKANGKYTATIDALKKSVSVINLNHTDSTVDITERRNAEIQRRIAEIEEERGEIRDHLYNIIDITKTRRATP